MKKLLFVISLLLLGTIGVSAQNDYKTGIGLSIDFGDNITFVGPAVKHFFDSHNVGVGELTFGDDVTLLTAMYQYHGPITNAAGLKWYGGGGMSIGFYDGGSIVFLRPTVGLDFKISNAPLAFSFDWRPSFALDSDVDDRFEPAGFGLGVRYILK